MSFIKRVTPAPKLIPRFNNDCLLDIVTGHPAKGMKGETIINGGLHHIEGGTGEANSAKTGLQLYRVLTTVSRYNGASAVIYDTETTLPRDRIARQAEITAPNLIESDGSVRNVELTTAAEISGDALFHDFKDYGDERSKLKADYIETPFKDPTTGEAIKILPPDIMFIDSLTKFSTSAIEDIQNKHDIGESGQNMVWMKDGAVKMQMLSVLPNITVKNGLYFVMTAQIGENKNLDPYAAPRQTLSFLKGNLKLKRVPDEYRYNVHSLWYGFKMKPLLNSTTKAPEYPRDSEENVAKGDTDLQEIMLMNLRGKSGSSGKPLMILYSQSEGVKSSLTEFHHCKEEGWGVTNSKGNYTIDLYPECKVGRTTIRNMLETDMKLKTAVKLMSDLLQIRDEWKYLPNGFVCDPKTLYEDIKAKGYDWDVLLQTRSYWTFDQYTNPVPFLSIMDLLYMREGTYHPYWLEKKNNGDSK